MPGAGTIELRPFAVEACRRYREEYPDEAETYGQAGVEWCIHDVQYMVGWAALDLSWGAVLAKNVTWLTRVLSARGFPLDRLARCLDLAADVAGADGLVELAECLRGGGRTVRTIDSCSRSST